MSRRLSSTRTTIGTVRRGGAGITTTTGAITTTMTGAITTTTVAMIAEPPAPQRMVGKVGKQAAARTRFGMLPAVLAAVCVAAAAIPARAALDAGAGAPPFSARAALGGREFTFSLADALQRGPVVVYFYPAAFTTGCTIEAHEFAEAMPRFAALGATVIGVSHDDIGTLDKFSVSACQSRFPVAADADGRIMKAYDARLPLIGLADRVSYVIAPDGKILYGYTDMSPQHHVTNTLRVLQEWRAAHPAPTP